jgi:hypothetical protein
MDEPRLIPEKYFEIVRVETTVTNMLITGKRCVVSEENRHKLQNTIVLCSDGNFAKETLHFMSRVNEFAKLKIFVLDDNDAQGESNCKQVSKCIPKALKIQSISKKYINDDNIMEELSKLMNNKNPNPISQQSSQVYKGKERLFGEDFCELHMNVLIDRDHKEDDLYDIHLDTRITHILENHVRYHLVQGNAFSISLTYLDDIESIKKGDFDKEIKGIYYKRRGVIGERITNDHEMIQKIGNKITFIPIDTPINENGGKMDISHSQFSILSQEKFEHSIRRILRLDKFKTLKES